MERERINEKGQQGLGFFSVSAPRKSSGLWLQAVFVCLGTLCIYTTVVKIIYESIGSMLVWFISVNDVFRLAKSLVEIET